MDGTWGGLVAHARLNAAVPIQLAHMAMIAIGLLGKLGHQRFRRKPTDEADALAAARALVLAGIQLALIEGIEPDRLLEVEHVASPSIQPLRRSRAPR